MNKLEVHNISKHYGRKKALDGFDFIFTDGIYGLLGPNGAGKTTLMNIITTNLKPDKDGGKILWNGEETRLLKEEFRSQLGFMPQQQNLYDNMTAFDFLGYMAALKKLDRKKAHNEIRELLKKVELEDCAEKKIGGFSGGMKQRVLIASAMLGNPRLLIMDEPTAGLDPKQRVIIKRLVSEMSKEMIVIISTHIISDIENIAKDILLLRNGKIIDSGTVSELTDKITEGEKNLENLYMHYYGGE
ncbi:MAG: ATP-binding cassette domain-containing protein [Oscillospiraceae bacterium]|nr:ATP-binding cassette domain-containing protein [Oscillospiraceae bacterium]